MNTNRIDATLSPGDKDEVLAAIATLKGKLPFLTTEERRAFVRRAAARR